MLETLKENQSLEYQKISPEEMQKRGILGRLYGPCCDIINPTRNGRKYSQELWEKAFDAPLVKEQFEAGGIFGELTHPDREEVAMEKIAIVMPEPPKKGKDGLLIGYYDILDTPSGRILKTLCDYGYKVGISTRGTGDLITDFNGDEAVDPKTYTLNALDIVTIPAVKAARLNYVNESYNGKTLQQALNENLNSANDNDKKIMKEALDNLNININEGYTPKNAILVKRIDDNKWHAWGGTDKDELDDDFLYQINHQEFPNQDYNVYDQYSDVVIVKNGEIDKYIDEDINGESLNIDEVNDDMSVDNDKDIAEELQTAIKTNNELNSKIVELQEKLSVCYAKEVSLQEDISKYQSTIQTLTKKSQKCEALQQKINSLNEQLKTQTTETTNKQHELDILSKKMGKVNIHKTALSEAIQNKDNTISNLNESVSKLENKINSITTMSNKRIETLNNNIAELKKDVDLKESNYNKKLESANRLVEKYKDLTKQVVNRYIESQANMLGISPNEIKNKLPQNYSINDIDTICEDLRDYKITLSKLPISTAIGTNRISEGIQAKVKNKTNVLPIPNPNVDDEIDDQLLGLIRK